MRTVPIPLVGPTYTNRSVSVSNQETKGFYIELNEHGETFSMMPFPGLKLWATTGTGKGRKFGKRAGVLHTISGTELYSVSSLGAATLVGTIPGVERCDMADDMADNLIITNGIGKPYSYDGTTLTQGTDVDLPNASTVGYLNDRVIYDGVANHATISEGLSFSDLNTPLTVNSANILASNTDTDKVHAVHISGQLIFSFGTESLEPISFIGTGTPPYSRVNNAVQTSGTIAKHSIASNNTFTYYLNNLKIPSRFSGLSIQPIGNPAIGKEIESYSDVSDAFGVCFTFDTLNFYMLSFPTANRTWLYNEQSNLWTSLSYGVNGDQHLIADYINIYDKHLVSDRRNGNIYELDFDTFTDNSDVIQRRRTTAAINGATYGKPGAKVFMSRLEVIIESGVSLVDSIGTIIMEMSDDNGRSWSSEEWHAIGEQGDYTYHLEWFGLGDFYTRMFRFTMTDPIKWVLISAHTDVELGV